MVLMPRFCVKLNSWVFLESVKTCNCLRTAHTHCYILFVLCYSFLFEYMPTIGFHHICIRWNYFPMWNTRRIMWIGKILTSASIDVGGNRKWVKLKFCGNCAFKQILDCRQVTKLFLPFCLLLLCIIDELTLTLKEWDENVFRGGQMKSCAFVCLCVCLCE